MRAVAPPVVYGSRFAALRRSFGRHKWRPYVCGWLNAVLWRSVCGVARGGAIYDARCRNGTCGRSRCVSVNAGGGRPVCGTASVIRVSQVAPLRLRVVECCFASVIRASQVAPLRLRVVVGGVTRGCRGKGMGMKKEAGLTLLCLSGFLWLRRLDSNERPPGYEPGELPTAPLRDVFLNTSAKVRLLEISSKFFADFFPFFEKCGVCGAVAGLSVWGVR